MLRFPGVLLAPGDDGWLSLSSSSLDIKVAAFLRFRVFGRSFFPRVFEDDAATGLLGLLAAKEERVETSDLIVGLGY
jgi:hypothetical protein